MKTAQVQIIERHQSLKEHPVVTNCVTEIYVHQMHFWITTNYKMIFHQLL